MRIFLYRKGNLHRKKRDLGKSVRKNGKHEWYQEPLPV